MQSSEFFEVFWDIFNLSLNFADMIELAQHIETLLLETTASLFRDLVVL